MRLLHHSRRPTSSRALSPLNVPRTPATSNNFRFHFTPFLIEILQILNDMGDPSPVNLSVVESVHSLGRPPVILEIPKPSRCARFWSFSIIRVGEVLAFAPSVNLRCRKTA
jgi:hypothetical protein